MAVNNNSPIPKEAIEGAAGIKDKFSINGLEFNQEQELVVSKSVKREHVLSTELESGMTIKAVTYKNRRKLEDNIDK